MDVAVYLSFAGDCAEAFREYERVLGGKMGMMMTYGEAPPGAGMGEGMQDKVMHARITVGGATLMGSDAPAPMREKAAGFNVSIITADVPEAERVFAALAEGGTVRMPLQEMFWAHRFGMVTDRFGTPWMINCERQAGAAPSS